MHPLSSNTMDRHHQQTQSDMMGDVAQEKFGSSNSLDNAERKR